MQVSLNGTKLNFEQIGSGPVILFLHDSTNNRAVADPLFASLAAAGYRVIFSNLRGFDGECTLADLTRDAVALLNYLGIGRAVTFGIGRGGYVLLDLLENHPTRIAVSTFVAPAAMAERLRSLAGQDELRSALQQGELDGLKATLLGSVPPADEGCTSLADLRPLRQWVERTVATNPRSGKPCSKLLSDMQLPPLLIEAEAPQPGGRGRRFDRLRAFNTKVLALFDLFSAKKVETTEYEEEDLAESL